MRALVLGEQAVQRLTLALMDRAGLLALQSLSSTTGSTRRLGLPDRALCLLLTRQQHPAHVTRDELLSHAQLLACSPSEHTTRPRGVEVKRIDVKDLIAPWVIACDEHVHSQHLKARRFRKAAHPPATPLDLHAQLLSLQLDRRLHRHRRRWRCRPRLRRLGGWERINQPSVLRLRVRLGPLLLAAISLDSSRRRRGIAGRLRLGLD